VLLASHLSRIIYGSVYSLLAGSLCLPVLRLACLLHC
jgi:hypothetical protein